MVERCRPGFTMIERRTEGGDWERTDMAVLRRGDTTRWTGELQRRPVRGRLVLPDGAVRALGAQAFLRRVPDRPEPPLPDEAAKRFGDERKKWMAEWVATTEEGAAYEADRVRFANQAIDVRLRVGAEGELTADQVPVGTYHLMGLAQVVAGAKVVGADGTSAATAPAPPSPAASEPAAREPATSAPADAAPMFKEPALYDIPGQPKPDADTPTREAFATATVRVEPAVAAGDDGEPVVLPELTLMSFQRLKVGEVVPDMVLRRLVVANDQGEALAVDGKAGETIRVRAYRGRYLLLDCWATWCGPCLEATPALKAIHEAYATAKNELVIVGVSFDEDPAAAARYVRQEALPWEQAVAATAGGASATADPVELGGLFGGGIPNFVLIDPHGRLASTGHDLSAVEAILAGNANRGGPPDQE